MADGHGPGITAWTADPCGAARSAMITKDELERLWRSARTPEQLDRYYELRRERDAATQLVLMVCACCHRGFQRLPKNALCRFCQGHSARRTIAENVLATLPGCTGVAAICTTSADEYECAGPHGGSAAQVARLLGVTEGEYARAQCVGFTTGMASLCAGSS